MSFFKPNIEKLRSKQDADALIRALIHRDEVIAREAEEAIVSMGSAAVGSLARAYKSLSPVKLDEKAGIIDLVNDSRLMAHWKILELLCRLDPSAAVTALTRGEERRGALLYLCLRGHAKALSVPLSHAPSDFFEDLVVDLLRCLSDQSEKSAEETKTRLIQAIVDLCVSKTSVGKLLKSFYLTEDKNLRRRMIVALADARPDELLHSLEFNPSERGGTPDILRSLGGQWATDGVLEICLSHPMGKSWEQSHVHCLKAIQDRKRAVFLLLDNLSRMSPSAEEGNIPATLYCLFYLLSLPSAGVLRFSEPEDLWDEGIAAEQMQQAKLDREVFGRLYDALAQNAIPREGDLDAVRLACESVLKGIKGIRYLP